MVISISPSPCLTWTCTLTCRKYDDTPPVSLNITSAQPDNDYFLANNNQIFNINWDAAWWSPIILIEWQFEDNNDDTLFNAVKSSVSDLNPSNKSELSTLEDISNVDGFIKPKKYREYTYNITKICDEAGNCISSPPYPKTFNYNSYANNIDLVKSSVTWTSNFDNKPADWTNKNLTINLKDQYDNEIVQVKRSDNSILRDVKVDLGYTNDLHLDQYNNTWLDTAIFADIFIPTIWIGNWIFNNYANWIYPINFKVFAPTYFTPWGEYATWNFTIDNIYASVSDSWLPVMNLLSNLNFKFNPLLETVIKSEIQAFWFLEWATQTWAISLTKPYVWGESITLVNLYLEYWSWATSPGLSNLLNMKVNNKSVWEWNWNRNTYSGAISIGDLNKPFNSLLTQSSLLNTITNQYLSSHISYNIGWKNVIYNSDIIGKNNYWGSSNLLSTKQVWLKILWKTHSQKQNNITTNQNNNNIHILGNIEKSKLKANVKINVYKIIKTFNDTYVWNQYIKDLNNSFESAEASGDNQGRVINDNILYIWDLNWNDVDLDLWSSLNISGNKTIVVEWWNLYIKSNIINTGSSDILWIIVLKNSNWVWWNIYIDPSVTRIDWIMYADKSLISYNWTELDWWTNQYVLRNQLYIYGSVFSENTIWGARETPPVCPYYIDASTCNLPNIAQKYDLNFLRRYFVAWGNALNWWINYKAIYDSTYPYFEYPVVIKYNPLIQKSPPPLFSD